MLIDFKKQILDLKGSSVKLPDGGDALLSNVCQEALMASFPDERDLSGVDKVKRFALALKIGESALPIEITSEDAADLKRLVAKAFGPLIVGRVWEIIN
jgi:hypothetical protein